VDSRKLFLLAALSVALLGAPALAYGNSPSGSPPSGYGASGAAPSDTHHRGGFDWMKNLDLTPQQQDQIKALIQAYRQDHPEGSPPDAAARQQLRQEILAVLTPSQRAQLEQEIQQWRAEHADQGQDDQQRPAASPSP
jgi:Spy/CpxP family protein refolding chaperone